MTKTRAAREVYLDIAARRFAETGFHGVSLAALAQEAGVTKQALLHFFGKKERLYAEVLARLAERLSADLASVDAPTPAARLVRYFDMFAAKTIAEPDDARLVVRALLDSDAAARRWPLKGYLDRVTALARQTPRWRDATAEETLAGVCALIGAAQYVAISSPTLAGMYGEAAAKMVETRVTEDLRRAARAFVERP